MFQDETAATMTSCEKTPAPSSPGCSSGFSTSNGHHALAVAPGSGHAFFLGMVCLLLVALAAGCARSLPPPRRRPRPARPGPIRSWANGIGPWQRPAILPKAGWPRGMARSFTGARPPTAKPTTCTAFPPPTRPCPWAPGSAWKIWTTGKSWNFGSTTGDRLWPAESSICPTARPNSSA